MKSYPISTVAEIIAGQSPPSSTYSSEPIGLPFYQGKVDFGEWIPRTRLWCSEPTKVAKEGDVLISVRAPVGPTNLATESCCIGRGLAAIRPNPEVLDSRFAIHFLRSIEGEIAALGRGSTFSAITTPELKKIEIQLPSKNGKPDLIEQQRIAAILDKADLIRRKRQQALLLTDDFLRSVFLDMFGDPSKHGWKMLAVTDMLSPKDGAMRTGPFGSQLLHSEFVDEGIAVLGIDNAVSNEFRWGKPRFITEAKYEEMQRYTVHPGDVIITIMGTVGRCAIVPDDIPTAINTKHLCCITLDHKKCLPEFLHAYFLTHPTARKYLASTAKGAIMDGLNMGIIKALPVPQVPLHLQEEYRDLVRAHSKMKVRLIDHQANSETLFSSLQQRAFSGQL
jgi:type I restriction enzyme S subunit